MLSTFSIFQILHRNYNRTLIFSTIIIVITGYDPTLVGYVPCFNAFCWRT